MLLGTLRELFVYNDWAWDLLADIAAQQGDEKLDQPFEMGNGSIRSTFHHHWGAEQVWLDRWRQGGKPPFPEYDSARSISAISELRRQTCADRAAFLESLTDADLSRQITFTTIRDNTTQTLPLAPMMMHVCTHGTHHRAQALNMLKRVGAPIPPKGIDYLFMKLKQRGKSPPNLSIAAIRPFFDYGDWAQQRVIAAARDLPDAALDREFDMGTKSIRANLRHVTYSESWWLENWTARSQPHYIDAPEPMSPTDLSRHHAEHATARNAFLKSVADADLSRVVHTKPSPGKDFPFPLGESMLQLCHHGVHHRAQTLNMLRHVGATPPGVDFITWLREGGQWQSGGRA